MSETEIITLFNLRVTIGGLLDCAITLGAVTVAESARRKFLRVI